MDRIQAGIRQAAAELSPEGWDAASHAIMTTDTQPKAVFRQAGAARLFGMAKGAGMIHPDMATMLSVIVTDAAVAPDALAGMLRTAVDASFNCVSVDGDMSTNDTVLVLANGAAGPAESGPFAAALTELCTELAQKIVRGGEGATRFITVRVQGAASGADAKRAAHAIANSPLVKTAFYGGDANWGRILAAVGYSGAMVEPERAALWIAPGVGAGDPVWSPLRAPAQGDGVGAGRAPAQGDGVGAGLAPAQGDHRGSPLQLVRAGTPLGYSEQAASAIFAGPEITVIVDLGLGGGQATVWTCDLSHEYVSINGHYRT
jgi:glutamate N-acetyltransferase/amino-acid N-acetyltransferase